MIVDLSNRMGHYIDRDHIERMACEVNGSEELGNTMRAQLRCPPRVPFNLWKLHPVLCGLTLFRWRIAFQKTGLDIVNNRGAITAVLHIHNALRQVNMMDLGWPDLETVVEAHSLDQFFLGSNRPKNLSQMVRNWGFVNGLSSTFLSRENLARMEADHNIVNERLRLASNNQQKRAKTMKTPTPLSQALDDSYEVTRQLRVSRPDVVKLMAQRTHRDFGSGFTEAEWTRRVVASFPMRSPGTQIKILAMALVESERTAFHFDYYHMQRMLDPLIEQFYALAPQTARMAIEKPKFNWINGLINELFMIEGDAMVKEDISCSSDHFVLGVIFPRVARLVSAYIEAQGHHHNRMVELKTR